jgi:release factor glutamine methyltransferase
MKTIQEVLTLATDYLRAKSFANPRKEAEDLIAAVIKCKRLDLYMRHDLPLEESELAILREWIKRRGQKEPLEYLTKETEFFHVQLEITPAVLIPRQETEILASKVAEKIKEGKHTVLWDVCCGSGALGLSLKKKFPYLEVTLSDISEEALKLAQKNAEKNLLDIKILQGDLFAPFEGQKTDFIVCNPPYIAESEYEALDHSVRLFEPKMALVGCNDNDGLEFYRRLKAEAKGHLKPGGWLCMEIGHTQGEQVLKLFAEGGWAKCFLEKDWSEKDRFVFCLESE